MSNSLRKLSDLYECGKLPFVELVISNKIARDEIHRILRHRENAVCFSMGDVDQYEAANAPQVIPDLVRLPYETCWFEGTWINEFGGQVKFGFLCTTDFEIEPRDDFVMRFMLIGFAMEFGVWKGAYVAGVGESGGAIEIRAPSIAPGSIALPGFLSALNCCNVTRTRVDPPTALATSRAKKKKKPLFSYWTLDLDLSSRVEGTPNGGTHASPRLHLRRGHARAYAPGKWCWVQPHVVGNKALGIVQKDYEVTKAA